MRSKMFILFLWNTLRSTYEQRINKKHFNEYMHAKVRTIRYSDNTVTHVRELHQHMKSIGQNWSWSFLHFLSQVPRLDIQLLLVHVDYYQYPCAISVIGKREVRRNVYNWNACRIYMGRTILLKDVKFC